VFTSHLGGSFDFVFSLQYLNLLGGSSAIIHGSIKTLYIVHKWGGNLNPLASTWDIEIYSPSTKRFDISMATLFIDPLGVVLRLESFLGYFCGLKLLEPKSWYNQFYFRT
jgi:hypothetical protein